MSHMPATIPGRAAPPASAAAAPDPDKLLSEVEVAELTGLGCKTLQRKRIEGGGPVFVRLGRRVMYRRADVQSWIAANTFASTSAETVAAQRGGKPA